MFGGGQPCTCKNCNARGFQPPPLRQAVQVFQPVNLAGQGQPAVARPMGEDLATILEHLENGGRWEQSMEDAISMVSFKNIRKVE